jgi:hypothetical protein
MELLKNIEVIEAELINSEIIDLEIDIISPDGFSISRTETYPTIEAAKIAFNKWKKGYELQGYYSSVKFGRIDLRDLEDFCQFINLNE